MYTPQNPQNPSYSRTLWYSSGETLILITLDSILERIPLYYYSSLSSILFPIFLFLYFIIYLINLSLLRLTLVFLSSILSLLFLV